MAGDKKRPAERLAAFIFLSSVLATENVAPIVQDFSGQPAVECQVLNVIQDIHGHEPLWKTKCLFFSQ